MAYTKNQALTIKYTDTDNKDFTAITLRIDYWIPGNDSDIKNGTINSAYITKAVGLVTIAIPKNFFNIIGDWHLQIFDAGTEINWSPRIVVPIVTRGSV